MEKTRRGKIVFKLKHPLEYRSGCYVESPSMGPRQSWQCRLKVYPSGTPGQNGHFLSAFVELIPPPSAGAVWECQDIWYSITVVNRHDEENSVYKHDTFTFSSEASDRGWHSLIRTSSLTSPFFGFVDENDQMEIQAEVHGLPSSKLFGSLDLTAELKPLTFRLASGPPLFFDQRLLTARSEYFQKMLGESATWRESSIGEVDLRSEPNTSQESVAAVLEFLMTDDFDPKDVSLALAVRALADRFCLLDLVTCADDALTSFLSEDNVLTLLGQLLDTGSEVEAACWQMLESDSKLLVKQEAMLDQLIEQQPALAKRLILLGRT